MFLFSQVGAPCASPSGGRVRRGGDPLPEHRIFAAIYDRLLAGTEKGGLREMPADLIREARGRTLELGAGTGHNLDHYPAAVGP